MTDAPVKWIGQPSTYGTYYSPTDRERVKTGLQWNEGGKYPGANMDQFLFPLKMPGETSHLDDPEAQELLNAMRLRMQLPR